LGFQADSAGGESLLGPQEIREMVDFTLTDEQKNLREMAHDFAVKEIRPVAWEYDTDGTWPQDIIEKAWDVGLMNSHIPEEYGGGGGG
jgi:acyl-CoA dehydrogenase